MTDKRLYSEIPSEHKCCGIPVDRACFAFGVFSVLVRGLDVVYYCVYDRELTEGRSASKSLETHLSFGFSLVSLLFSIILCYGAQKRRPDLLTVYLVYGIVVNVLMVAASLIVLLLTPDTAKALIVLVECAIYTAILLMVKLTREIFLAEKSSQPQDPETCIESKALNPEACKEGKALDPQACKVGKAYSSIEPSVPKDLHE